MSEVFIAVNLDSGWDNIVGVYDTYEKAFAACKPSDEELEGEDGKWYENRVDPRTGMYDMHIIHTKRIQ